MLSLSLACFLMGHNYIPAYFLLFLFDNRRVFYTRFYFEQI